MFLWVWSRYVISQDCNEGYKWGIEELVVFIEWLMCQAFKKAFWLLYVDAGHAKKVLKKYGQMGSDI